MSYPVAEYLQVETTTDSREEASALSASVVRERLAACTQIVGPITSTFWWDEQVEQDEEWLVLMKTSADCLDALTAHVNEQHSYDVPEVVAVPITGGSSAYLSWVTAETRGASTVSR